MRTILILRKAARHEGGPGARPVATKAVQSSKASHPEGLATARGLDRRSLRTGRAPGPTSPEPPWASPHGAAITTFPPFSATC